MAEYHLQKIICKAVNVLQNALKRGLTNESGDVEYAFLLVFLQIVRLRIGDFPLLSSTSGWKKMVR